MTVSLLFTGIIMGCIIAQVAMGLTLIWGIDGFINVAQGAQLTAGAYFAYYFYARLGMSISVAATLTVLTTCAVVLGVYFVAVQPLGASSPTSKLLATLACHMVIISLVAIAWGSAVQTYGLPVQRDYEFHGLLVSRVEIAILVATGAVVAVMYMLIFRSRLGRRVRAVADRPELARVAGISVQRIEIYIWIINGVCCALAGVLLGAQAGVYPLMGWQLLLTACAAVVLGGIGNPFGAVVGGLIAGCAMATSTLWISPAYEVAVAFGVLAIALILRPKGLFTTATGW